MGSRKSCQTHKMQAKAHLDNMVKHFKGIVADPPDPNFRQPTSLDTVNIIDAHSSDQLIVSSARIGSEASKQGALLQALLSAIERYAGVSKQEMDSGL